MSDWFIDQVNRLGLPVPHVFVETGTYLGITIAGKADHFREVHSIDLSEEFVKNARQKFSQLNVTIHHGDSAEVLVELSNKLQEPVIFYLDAHYSGGTTAFGRDEVPLLRELAVLGNRPYNDIIFVDDTRLFGRSGVEGTPGCKIYPMMHYDWRDITMEAVFKAYGKPVRAYRAGSYDRMILVHENAFVEETLTEVPAAPQKAIVPASWSMGHLR